MGEEKPEEELMGKTDYISIMDSLSQGYTYGSMYSCAILLGQMLL